MRSCPQLLPRCSWNTAYMLVYETCRERAKLGRPTRERHRLAQIQLRQGRRWESRLSMGFGAEWTESDKDLVRRGSTFWLLQSVREFTDAVLRSSGLGGNTRVWRGSGCHQVWKTDRCRAIFSTHEQERCGEKREESEVHSRWWTAIGLWHTLE